MAQYTIEDIEILRQKSGISYEEAVNLLTYHNGSLARSLVDLEKNGRILDAKATAQNYGHRGRGHHLFNRLYRTRFTIFKGDITILNISMLFMIFSVLVAGWLVLFGVLAALLMGYRMRVVRNSSVFARESLESIIQRAGDNVKATVQTITKEINAKPKADNSQTQPDDSAAFTPEMRSESPASGTTPVNVQFSEDGNIRVRENVDGFHEAEIQ